MSDNALDNQIAAHAVSMFNAFASNNHVAAADIPSLMATFREQAAIGINGATAVSASDEGPFASISKTPAVPVKKSIQNDHLVCLIDGKKMISLKRHLRTKYGMSPDDYRSHYNLPGNYPMVSPAYAAKRSELAKSMGLGKGGRVAKGGGKVTPTQTTTEIVGALAEQTPPKATAPKAAKPAKAATTAKTKPAVAKTASKAPSKPKAAAKVTPAAAAAVTAEATDAAKELASAEA